MRKLPVLLLLAATLLILTGVLRSENGTVLNKGINLCLECVGIG